MPKKWTPVNSLLLIENKTFAREEDLAPALLILWMRQVELVEAGEVGGPGGAPTRLFGRGRRICY